MPVSRGECEGKQPFATRALAKTVMDRKSHRGRPENAYRCPYCQAWHIGTVKAAAKDARKRVRVARERTLEDEDID